MASLLEMSIAGGLIILAAVLLRAALLDRLPKGTFLALWALAALRLTVPVKLPFRFSLFTLLRRAAPHTAGPAPIPAAVTPPGQAAPQVVDIIQDIPQADLGRPFPTMTVIWLAGAALCAGLLIANYIRCRRAFRGARPVENDFTTAFFAAHPIRRTVSVRLSDAIAAPLTYGLIRPVILLPVTVDWADEETLLYVFTHELVHIRRLDALWKPLLAAVACLHWFNPLVWLMLALAGRDMELACDEAVVRALGREARKGYARALLTMEERRGGLAAASYFSKNATEERIRSIMKIRPKSFLSIFLAFTLVLTVGGALATSAAAAAEDNHVLYVDLIPDRCGAYDGYFELSREDFETLCAQEEPRWWGYEDYADEALRLKAEAAGLAGATVQYPDGTAIHWTQERVDAYGARYDAVLEAIGQGLKLSGTPGCHLAEDPTGGELIAMLMPPAADDREAPTETEVPVMYSGNVISSSDGTVYVFTEDGEPVSMTQQEYKVLFDIPEVEWWTAEEYAAWLEQEKKDLQNCLGQRAWTNSDGWFTWTQEKIDEAIEMYEQVLTEIENGMMISKPMADGALLYEGVDTAAQSSGGDTDGVRWWTTEDEAISRQAQNDQQAALTEQLDQWEDALAPYVPFGVTYEYDEEADDMLLYWNGQRIRGISDTTAEVWITAHSGDGTWPAGTPEAIAVYEDGQLTGLRLAAEEEQEQWDWLRAVSGSPNRAVTPAEPETEGSTLYAEEDVTTQAEFLAPNAVDRDVYGSLEDGMEVTVAALNAAEGNTVSVGLLTRTDVKLEVSLRCGEHTVAQDVELTAGQPQTVELYPDAAGEYDLCLKNIDDYATEFIVSCLVT